MKEFFHFFYPKEWFLVLLISVNGLFLMAFRDCRSTTTTSCIHHTTLSTSLTMNDTITLHQALIFGAPLDSLTLILKEIIITEEQDLRLLLEVPLATYQVLETQQFFHNLPEYRLDKMEIPFEEEKPIYLKLEWRRDKKSLLPPLSTDWKVYVEQASSTDPLLQEEHWNLLSAMQRHYFHESLGGGFARTGYRTKFTKPLNANDALRRKGPVTAAVVQALIESYFPVDYQEAQQGFVLELKLGGEAYKVLIKAQEEQVGLRLEVQPQELLTKAQSKEAKVRLEMMNTQNSLGSFQVEAQQLIYAQEMKIPLEMVHYKWVQESLLTALSIVHQQYQVLLLVEK